ncbi:fumarylacetoacetate hydrolase family protein [Afifella sp. IM 167]|uniref:fumarylacetoacetate hydrolase family protein n=1 Tax=Afifella sp. IM 167 TaxID=2033586 RepID=UPI001CCA2E27|nr:fumarylacetoacetate hydrolase family protein [Afifella sp. IM 167]MBZ8132136.1 2-hydroxyhepta-2,4-diene-1,7-dioate isomerase [Afifella sp. IM 167]
MRLVTFRSAEGLRAGAVKKENGNDVVVDLAARMGISSTRRLIAESRLAEASALAERSPADLLLSDIELDLPLTNPPKILCIGVNYQNRNAEYRDGSDPAKYPSIFMRTPLSFVPHGKPVLIPPESEELDYEGEIVLVIGRKGRRIPRAEAHGYIAGLTIMNEGTVRDWLRHAKFNVTQGKNFDSSGGLGPWIETDLSALDLKNLKIQTRVNGEIRQSDTTASMSFPIDHIIEYVSTFTTLLPGDLIATGTPTGAGARFDPPKWLRPGDKVEVEVEGVGTLVNPVAAETVV